MFRSFLPVQLRAFVDFGVAGVGADPVVTDPAQAGAFKNFEEPVCPSGLFQAAVRNHEYPLSSQLPGVETRVTPAAVSEDDLRKRKLADVHGCVLVMRWSRSTRGGYAGLCKNMTALLPPNTYNLEVAFRTVISETGFCEIPVFITQRDRKSVV